MNSFKRVCAFQIELEFCSVVFGKRGKPEYAERNLSEQGREPIFTTTSSMIQSFAFLCKLGLLLL